eukprot:Selendium_serpulae@DN6516_c2_g5_i2.p1
MRLGINLVVLFAILYLRALHTAAGAGTHVRRVNVKDRMKSWAESFVLAPDEPADSSIDRSRQPKSWAAAIGRQNCTSFYGHSNWGDGFGHQLQDIFSLMVYHLINDDGECFVANEYGDFFLYPPIGHQCKNCVYMFNQLM